MPQFGKTRFKIHIQVKCIQIVFHFPHFATKVNYLFLSQYPSNVFDLARHPSTFEGHKNNSHHRVLQTQPTESELFMVFLAKNRGRPDLTSYLDISRSMMLFQHYCTRFHWKIISMSTINFIVEIRCLRSLIEIGPGYFWYTVRGYTKDTERTPNHYILPNTFYATMGAPITL